MTAAITKQLACLFALALLMGTAEAATDDDDASTCATVRGLDPRTVALVFDVDGGQMPRGTDGPLLSVDAAGMATVRGARIGDAAISQQLPVQAQCTCIHTLLDDFDLLSVNAQSIRAAIERASPRARVADASTTSLRITWPGARHEISIYALRQMAQRHPKIEALQRFRRAADYLTELADSLLANAAAKTSEPPQTP